MDTPSDRRGILEGAGGQFAQVDGREVFGLLMDEDTRFEFETGPRRGRERTFVAEASELEGAHRGSVLEYAGVRYSIDGPPRDDGIGGFGEVPVADG